MAENLAAVPPPGVHIAQFVSDDAGKPTGTARAVDGGCPPHGMIAINGSTDLSSCIAGLNGATVYSIHITTDSFFFQYRIEVDGQGPRGGVSVLELHFTDSVTPNPDTYDLSIYDSSRAKHHVDYNSGAPNIVAVTWFPA